MGMQGPLTAQALGRSPFDDVVEGSDEVEEQQTFNQCQQHQQQYDNRGRPINPETKRINRDIIRSHNEVMLVIGVAEQETANLGPNAEVGKRHQLYEDDMGIRLGASAHRCVEAIGLLGLHGLRQRILIYKRYSNIPFWDLFQAARNDFSFTRDILPGAPAGFFSNYVDRKVAILYHGHPDKTIVHRCAVELWSYARVHLELFIALQRLRLIPSDAWFPRPSFFIPFTQDSPIPQPPPLEGLSFQSLLKWFGGLVVSATPFLAFVLTQRLIRDWRPQIWVQIFKRLPNTAFSGRRFPPPPPPPPPGAQDPADEDTRSRPEQPQDRSDGGDSSPLRAVDGQIDTPVQAVRRASTFSARGVDWISDDEDNDGVNPTLISFDVEASDSADVPAGLWSAELRASAPDARMGTASPEYYDSMLTQLPPLVASHLFTNSITRLLIAPYEATALRLIARAFQIRHGLPFDGIIHVNVLSTLTMTTAVNFLCTEFLHLLLSGEIWAGFTIASQWLHMTEEEWQEAGDGAAAAGWSEE